jgi:predicted nuclease of predicted toxin-antitoxin system
MRLVLDQGIPRDAAIQLHDAACEVIHVGDLGMSAATDGEILAWAVEHEATVVTLDADFHAILAVTAASGPSVIRVRIEGLDAPAIAGIIRAVLADFLPELVHGCLLTVKARKITCHRLPIGGPADSPPSPLLQGL